MRRFLTIFAPDLSFGSYHYIVEKKRYALLAQMKPEKFQ